MRGRRIRYNLQMTQRVKFITHQGKEILSIDFSSLKWEEFLRTMEEAKNTIATRPKSSVLTLTNVERAHFSPEISDPMKAYIIHNKPYVKAGAVIGLDGLKMFMFNVMNRLAGRSLQAIDGEDAAKEWLVENSG